MHCRSAPEPQKKHRECYKNEIPTPNRPSAPLKKNRFIIFSALLFSAFRIPSPMLSIRFKIFPTAPYQYRSQMTRRNLGKFQLKGRQNTKFSSAERHVRQGDDYIESRENGAYCKTEHFLGKRETSPLALPQTHRPWLQARCTPRP